MICLCATIKLYVFAGVVYNPNKFGSRSESGVNQGEQIEEASNHRDISRWVDFGGFFGKKSASYLTGNTVILCVQSAQNKFGGASRWQSSIYNN